MTTPPLATPASTVSSISLSSSQPPPPFPFASDEISSLRTSNDETQQRHQQQKTPLVKTPALPSDLTYSVPPLTSLQDHPSLNTQLHRTAEGFADLRQRLASASADHATRMAALRRDLDRLRSQMRGVTL
eukprot:Sspe_Gene.56254::Locus_30953_Transcript_1_1_Confidence_1.000_Length_877::g.56254::m.56254